MAGPKQPAIGEVLCPTCREVIAEIKKTKNGARLFVNCPRCGPDYRKGQWLQDWILDKGIIFKPGDKPTPPAPEIETPTETPPKPTETPRRKGSLDDWFGS